MRSVSKLYGLQLLVHGRPAREYLNGDRSFVEARPGSEYRLYLRNDSTQRVAVAVTVDGISVTSSIATDPPAYIMESHSFIDILGWRIDYCKIARFMFCGMERAYVFLMANPKVRTNPEDDVLDVGRINAIFYREQGQGSSVDGRSSSMHKEPKWVTTKPARKVTTGFGRQAEDQ